MRISDWSSDVCSSDLRPIDSAAHRHTGQGGRRGMFLSRRNWLYGTALLLTAALATAATAAGGEAFVDELALYDKTQWRKSDGWANRWSKHDTGWVGRPLALAGGRTNITLTNQGDSRPPLHPA